VCVCVLGLVFEVVGEVGGGVGESGRLHRTVLLLETSTSHNRSCMMEHERIVFVRTIEGVRTKRR